jgi:hypothetical protein
VVGVAEAKSKALTFRIIAAVLWAIAIGGELFTIFWVLRQDPIRMWLLIVMLVVIGAFALGGSLLWKKANRLDPASRKDTVRFFVQNQLGVIITVIAFLPLIVMIFLNKDMDGKQKGIAGGIAIVIAAAVGLASADWNPPSVEQYSVETNVVKELTGKDEVVWVKGGSAFHVCEDVPDLRRSTKTRSAPRSPTRMRPTSRDSPRSGYRRRSTAAATPLPTSTACWAESTTSRPR